MDPTDHQVYIIAHSLGTFVTYEGLHEIILAPQTLGIDDDFSVQRLFTMGTPLGFIHKERARLLVSRGTYAINQDQLDRPRTTDPTDGSSITNVEGWLDFRHKLDPIASLVPTPSECTPDALTPPPFEFDAFNAGANMHAFENYIRQYASEVMKEVGR